MRRVQIAAVLVSLLGLNCTAHRPRGAVVHRICERLCGQEPRCVSGLVRDLTGEPVAEFSVGAFHSFAEGGDVSDMPFAMTETDASGRYTLGLTSALGAWPNSSSPEPFVVLAIEPGYLIDGSGVILQTPACVDLVVERAKSP